MFTNNEGEKVQESVKKRKCDNEILCSTDNQYIVQERDSILSISFLLFSHSTFFHNIPYSAVALRLKEIPF